MIYGDELVITRKGIHVSNKSLETIGIFPKTQVYLLPFITYECRETEPGYHFPLDLLVTPISPKSWPFVMRFAIRLRNQPDALQGMINLLRDMNIDILFSECTRSGHHHALLNIIGEITILKRRTLLKMYEELKEWIGARKNIFKTIYFNVFKESDRDELQSELGYTNEDPPFTEPHWWEAIEYFALIQKNSPTLKEINDKIEELRHERDEMKKGGPTNEEKVIKLDVKLRGYELVKLDMEGQPNKNNSVQSLFELTINSARPKVVKHERDRDKGNISHELLYYNVEEETVLSKILLTFILAYKRMLCERYKIYIIEGSLPEKLTSPDSKSDNVPPEVFLYNLKYYFHQLQHPQYSEKSLITSNFQPDKERILRIFKRISHLPEDRKGPWSWEPRLDLDPIIITPVEFLCHAAYHRAYENSHETITGDSFIPFPEQTDFAKRLFNKILPEENSSTIAIASRNMADFTLRLCPLTMSSLKRFKRIELTRYYRECNDQCSEKITEPSEEKFIPDDSYINSKEEDEHNFNKKSCNEKTEESSTEAIDLSEIQTTTSEKVEYKIQERLSEDNYDCSGTSMGLLSQLISAVSKKNRSTNSTISNFNIWRMFNKTYKKSKKNESGSVYILVQNSDKNFHSFSKDFASLIDGRFKNKLSEQFKSGHVRADTIESSSLSGGKIFVSLPFSHPMNEVWFETIERIGSMYGFSIQRSKQYLGSVTDSVVKLIRDSHGMIQILAYESNDKTKDCIHSSWLDAEYLTAKTNNLKVVRLIDEATIDEKALRIGRDQAVIKFNIFEPYSKFEEHVQDAFKHLRKELAATLGLS